MDEYIDRITAASYLSEALPALDAVRGDLSRFFQEWTHDPADFKNPRRDRLGGILVALMKAALDVEDRINDVLYGKEQEP